MNFSLPDKDVFALDAAANPPVQVAGAGGFYTGVGTILYNMAVNPVSGRVYVSNTDALNNTSFEGAGIFAGHSLRGHFDDNRITILDPSGTVTPRDLNTHINFASCCAPVPNAESVQSLALATGMAVSSDGKTLYAAVLGIEQGGHLQHRGARGRHLHDERRRPGDRERRRAHRARARRGARAALRDDAVRRRHLDRRPAGARGDRARDDAEPRAAERHEGPPVPLRRASFGSAHGDSACATCHVFGDFDSLAWTLGNPDDATFADNNPFATPLVDPTTGQPVAPESSTP